MATRGHSSASQLGGTYFMTASVVGWKHIFTKEPYLKKLIDTLLFYQNERKVRTAGYCVMPSHFHWIFKLPEDQQDVAKVLRTFKSYIATQTLKGLEIEAVEGGYRLCEPFVSNRNVKRESPASLLSYFTHLAEEIPDQAHRFWQRDSDLKAVVTFEFLRQKLQYIHNNPIQPQWQLVEKASDYRYSSCRFYEDGTDWNGIQIEVLW